MAKTDEIMSAISKALYEEFHNDFGDTMLISKDKVTQGLTANAFVINCVAPDVNKDFSKMYHANFLININYFPDETQDEINKQIYDVIERLDNIFETLKINDNLFIHATSIDKNITEDNVLVYSFYLKTHLVDNVSEDNTMEEVEINQEVK